MMIDKTLRSPKERLLRPLAKQLEISPLNLTMLALAIGLLAVATAALGYYSLALLFWLVNRLLDGLDGELARLKHTQTDLGGYLDILSDFSIYALLPLALVYSQASPLLWLLLALLLSSFYLNAGSWMYLAALLEKRQHHSQERTSITMPSGLIEGAETVLFYCLFLLFPNALVPLFIIMIALMISTIAQRLLWAKRYLRA